MYARPARYADHEREPCELAAAYRVTLWEQPADPGVDMAAGIGWSPLPGAPMGWEEMTFDLVGAQDVREAIHWAKEALASDLGPASRRGVQVQDREYVIYARGPNADCWLHVAGWVPTRAPEPPLNLRRLQGQA